MLTPNPSHREPNRLTLFLLHVTYSMHVFPLLLEVLVLHDGAPASCQWGMWLALKRTTATSTTMLTVMKQCQKPKCQRTKVQRIFAQNYSHTREIYSGRWKLACRTRKIGQKISLSAKTKKKKFAENTNFMRLLFFGAVYLSMSKRSNARDSSINSQN